MADETTIDTILRTKLYRPPVPRDYVHRPRLLEYLDQRRGLPLTLVSAPAGYDKSVLISSWLETYESFSAWLSLDEQDNDLRLFLSYFLAAVHGMFPDAVSKTTTLVNASTLPPVSVLSRCLINELDSIEHDFILVLDDIHRIQEKSVYDLLTELLRYPPRPMHLVLIGRRDVSLPTASLRAKGLVTEIRLNDLRFTLEETASYLRTALGDLIDEASAATLTEKAEGWITGLRLAVLAMRRHDNAVGRLLELKGTTVHVTEYLITEVIDAQPSAVRRYLLNTSILNRFCAPLCELLCGPDSEPGESKIDGIEFIARLQKDNLFLIALDMENHWFRFHHLFRQLLKNRLNRQRSPEEIASLHQHASSWFEENGLIEEAMGHSLEGRDFKGAGRLVSHHGHRLLGEERVRDLERWLRQLPRETIENDPMLLIFEAWLGRVRVQIPVISDRLNRAEALLRAEPETGDVSDCLWGYLNCIRSFERYAILDTDGAFACSRRGIDLIPEKYGYMRSFSFVVHGAALQMKGQFRDAVSVIESALTDVTLQGGYMQGIMLHSLSKICMMEASLLSQRNTANRLLKASKRAGLLVFICWGRFNLACSHYLLNELEAAKHTLAPFVEHRYALYPDTVSDCAAILSLTCQELNQPHEARHIADLLGVHALETENSRLKVIGEALQAELALRQGRLAEASAWARVFVPRQLHAHYFFYLPELTLARVLVAEDTPDSRQRARNLLSDIEKFSRATHNILILIPVLALQAILLDKAADESASLERLEESVSLAEPGGGIRFFLDQGPPMADLLKGLRKRNVAVDYIDKLLAAFRDDKPVAGPKAAGHPIASAHQPLRPSIPSQPLVEPLTNRELDVMELLAQRLQNKEIAEKLFISDETVKGHLKNIYQKLGVSKRREAVQKAKNLRII